MQKAASLLDGGIHPLMCHKAGKCQSVGVLYTDRSSLLQQPSAERRNPPEEPRKYRQKFKCNSCSYIILSVILELLRVATGKVLQYRNDSKKLLQWSLTHADALELEVQGQMRENPWIAAYKTGHTVELFDTVI